MAHSRRNSLLTFLAFPKKPEEKNWTKDDLLKMPDINELSDQDSRSVLWWYMLRGWSLDKKIWCYVTDVHDAAVGKNAEMDA